VHADDAPAPAPAAGNGSVVLRAEGLVKDYRVGRSTLRVLHSVDMDLREGERLCIVGSSGAGKSTLLHLLGMLDTPTAGRVLWHDTDLATLSPRQRALWRNRLFGFVFQFYHLLPDFTAAENVAMPALVSAGVGAWRRARAEALERAHGVLDLVGLADRARHRPGQLSGGERQRVAIARALVNRPQVLLCDEPTGNLDSATGHSVLALLDDVQRETACTLVMVTHDEEIARHADRTLRLHDGRIAAPDAT